MSERVNISSGSPWEPIAGYSRAVRVGSRVHVAGTTSIDESGEVVGGKDPRAQTRQALSNIERALAQAGAELKDVVRTRIYVTDAKHAEIVARAHGEVFSSIRPAATLVVVSALVDPKMLVEIEAEAEIDAS